MSVLSRFRKKEKVLQKTIEVDCEIFEKIEYLSSNVYDATVSAIINECVDELIKTENIKLYLKKENAISTKHSIMFRKSSLDGLEKLRKKYGISICKLIDISLRNEFENVKIESFFDDKDNDLQ